MQFFIKSVLCSLLLLTIPLANAHDFWLNPTSFHEKQAPANVKVKFMVGHADDLGPWALTWDRIVALRTYSDGAYQDQMSNIVVNQQFVSGLANISLTSKGTHVLGFESYHSFSSLEADAFNNYAEKEGLALVLEHRQQAKQTQQSGRELYSRKAKSLLQVGDAFTNNVTQPIGHTLEIVPVQNPYNLDNSDTLPVKVLFRGKPLENALIDIAPLQGSKMQKQEARTNNKGEATFTIETKGSWIVNVIWAVPLYGNQRAEFESYFSSLTFGYDESK